jgi:hypothetical protein
MPFFSDIGPSEEARSPLWASFATLADQVERLVVVNVCWALQLVPGLVALAFPELPVWLRVVLGLYSATVLPVATAVLYGLAAEACRGQHVDFELAMELARSYCARSLRVLAPLYGTFGVLVWLFVLLSGVAPVQTALTLVALLWSVCATWFAVTFVASPAASVVEVARRSVRLAWQRPERTLLTWLLTVLALLLGTVSIGGLVLIVPVFVAVLHTHQHAASRL